METTQNGAAASSSAADDDRELRELEERRGEIERRRQERERAAQGPRDREEQLLSGLVELVTGAVQQRPVNELRARAGKVLEALKA